MTALIHDRRDAGRLALLRSWRKIMKVTQREIAERARTVQPEVSLLERGRRNPQSRTVAKISKALGVPERFLQKPCVLCGHDPNSTSN